MQASQASPSGKQSSEDIIGKQSGEVSSNNGNRRSTDSKIIHREKVQKSDQGFHDEATRQGADQLDSFAFNLAGSHGEAWHEVAEQDSKKMIGVWTPGD